MGFWLRQCPTHLGAKRNTVFPQQTGSIDCRVRGHIILSVYWTDWSFIQVALAVYTANRWHLNYGWCTPAGLELTALQMATLQMAFYSWLINTIKHSLFIWDEGQSHCFGQIQSKAKGCRYCSWELIKSLANNKQPLIFFLTFRQRCGKTWQD